MAGAKGSEGPQSNASENQSDDAFSSEKREDIWAILIATVVLLVSVAFPEALHHFFSKTLFLF